jgi:hypothetical protein
MAQLQHNMLVAGTQRSVLSIINGGGKWIELSIEALLLPPPSRVGPRAVVLSLLKSPTKICHPIATNQ